MKLYSRTHVHIRTHAHTQACIRTHTHTHARLPRLHARLCQHKHSCYKAQFRKRTIDILRTAKCLTNACLLTYFYPIRTDINRSSNQTSRMCTRFYRCLPCLLQLICSYVFAPLPFFMGVETGDCAEVARLIGTKLFLTEIVAYHDLGVLMRNRRAGMSPHISVGSAHVASFRFSPNVIIHGHMNVVY